MAALSSNTPADVLKTPGLATASQASVTVADASSATLALLRGFATPVRTGLPALEPSG
jgi:hypothetical protein